MLTTTQVQLTGFVTPQWVKKRYAISNATLYAWIARSYLPPLYRVGPRAVRFRAEDIQRFEESLSPRNVQTDV